MALITWNEKLSVNIAEIDKQHQKLIQMVNDLDDAMRQGKGRDLLGKILGDMIKYTSDHFTTEEKYFAQYSYPDAENHIKEHKTFVEKVLKFQREFEAKRFGLSTDIINFLCNWLNKHILGTDKKYGPFFNEKGIK